MRTNLITHFHCSNCGHQLNVEYDSDCSPKKITDVVQTTREPTGACCRYNRIIVEPCKKCIEKSTRPAQLIAEGLKALGADND